MSEGGRQGGRDGRGGRGGGGRLRPGQRPVSEIKQRFSIQEQLETFQRSDAQGGSATWLLPKPWEVVAACCAAAVAGETADSCCDGCAAAVLATMSFGHENGGFNARLPMPASSSAVLTGIP